MWEIKRLEWLYFDKRYNAFELLMLNVFRSSEYWNEEGLTSMLTYTHSWNDLCLFFSFLVLIFTCCVSTNMNIFNPVAKLNLLLDSRAPFTSHTKKLKLTAKTQIMTSQLLASSEAEFRKKHVHCRMSNVNKFKWNQSRISLLNGTHAYPNNEGFATKPEKNSVQEKTVAVEKQILRVQSTKNINKKKHDPRDFVVSFFNVSVAKRSFIVLMQLLLRLIFRGWKKNHF